MDKVDISIVIAVKDEQIYVEQAILSILNQKGISIEVIVIDDGSKDNTFEIIRNIQKTNPCIKLFRNPNIGKNYAFNYGVEKSSGDYVCIFAGDDIMPEGSLEARWKMINQYPLSESIVGLCKLMILSEDKSTNGQLIPRRTGEGCFSGVSYLMTQQSAKAIFPVPTSLPNEDTWMELTVRHLNVFKIIHSDIIGCEWRVHSNNSINLLSDFEEFNRKITLRKKVLNIFYEKYENALSAKDKKLILAKIQCEEYRQKGDFLKILFSRDEFIDRLRAISTSNSFFYNIRKRYYSLFSGW